jgi:hypothetical protein
LVRQQEILSGFWSCYKNNRKMAVKHYGNNEAVSLDICTRSEGGGDVEGNKDCK